MTSCAGWLLAAGLLAALAAGALSLSPDGARLRRLAAPASKQDARGEAVAVAGQMEDAASYESKPAGGIVAADVPGWEGDTAERGFQGGAEAYAGSTAHRRGVFEATPDELLAPPDIERDPSSATWRIETDVPGGPHSVPVTSGRSESHGSIRAEVMGQAQQVQVLLDGVARGVAPVLFHGVTPGMHTLTFALGEQLWEEKVSVSAGDTTLAVSSPPDPMAPGQVFVEPYRDARGTPAGIDSVSVDGCYKGQGKTALRLAPGYHSISFARSGLEERNIVLFVPPGSVHYVTPPDINQPISMRHNGPEREGGSFVFTLHLRPATQGPSDVLMCVVPPGIAPLKVARMGLRTSDGAFVATIAASSLPMSGEAAYFFRVTLASGEEIDSRIYVFDPTDRGAGRT